MTNYDYIKTLTPEEFAKEFIFCSDKKTFDGCESGVGCKVCRVEWLTAERDKPEDYMNIHIIKIRAELFGAVVNGKKTFLIAENTQDKFEPGDMVIIDEIGQVGAEDCYTGRDVTAKITYVQAIEEYHRIGLKYGYSILSIKLEV